MSKTLKAKVSFEVEKSAVKNLQSVINDFSKVMGDDLAKKSSGDLTAWANSLESAMSRLKEMGGRDAFNSKEYELVFTNINKATRQIEKFLDKNIKLISPDDQKAVDELSKGLSKLYAEKEKILSLKPIVSGTEEKYKDNRSKEIITDIKRDGMGPSGQVDKEAMKYIQATNRANLDSLRELIQIDNKRTETLSKTLTGGKGSKKEKDRLAILKKEESARKKVLKLIKDSEKAIEKEVESNRLLERQLEEVNNEIREKEKLQSEIAQRTPVGGLLDTTKEARNKLNIGKQEKEDFTYNKKLEKIDRESDDSLSLGLVDEFSARFLSTAAIVKGIQRLIGEVLDTVGALDQAFVNIAVVTQYTNKEVWGMYESFKGIARESGLSVETIASVAGEYFRQGEAYSNVLQLTEAASMAAKVAGIDAAESVRYLTSAIRGYNLEASDAMTISDKFAAVAASTATDYDGLATAMSKVAAQAYANGVKFDNLMGMMATAMDVTQEAPENIGTAFKTIFARMAEVKDYGKTLEDGIDANRIETSLRMVNVELFDQNREMRDLDDVLLEVGSQWSSLNKTQKAYLATTLAGSRQQTRLLAVFENYDKTLKNIQTSQNAAGATEAQQRKNMDSISHSLNEVNIAFESLIKNTSNASVIIKVIDGFAFVLEKISGITGTTAGIVAFYGLLGKGALGLANKFDILEKASRGINFLDGKMTKGGDKILLFFMHAQEEIKKLGTLTKEQGFAKSIQSLYKDFPKATKESGAFTKSLKTFITNPYAIAIAAIGASLMAFSYVVNKANRDIEKFNQRMSDIRVALYDIGQTSNTFEDLVAEYEKLDQKVVKTNDDLQRQTEILKQIQDLDMDNAIKFNIDGKLDKGSVEAYRKQIEAEQDALFNEQKVSRRGQNNSKQQLDKLDPQAQRMAYESIMMDSLELEREQWEKITDAQKEMYINYLKLDPTRFRAEPQIVNAGGSTFGVVDGETDFKQEAENALKNMEYFIRVKEEALLASTTVAELAADLRNVMGESMEDIVSQDAFGKLLLEYEQYATLTVIELQNVDKMFDILDSKGVEITEDFKQRAITGLDAGGIEQFVNILIGGMRDAELSVNEVTSAIIQMGDALDGVTLDSIMDDLVTFDSMGTMIREVNVALEDLNADSLQKVLDLMGQFPEYTDMMVQSLEESGIVSEKVYRDMAANKKTQIETNIKNEIAQKKAERSLLEAEMALYKAILEDEVAITLLAKQEEVNVAQASAEEISYFLRDLDQNYRNLGDNIINIGRETAQKYAEAMTGTDVGGLSIGSFDMVDIQGTDKLALMKRNVQRELQTLFSGTGSKINILSGEIYALEAALGSLESGEWNKSLDVTGKKAEKAGKAAKEAAANVELYTGELHKLYVAQQRLAVMDWGTDLIKSQREYAKAANAVKGLAGAQDSMYKGSVANTMEDEFAALELMKQQLLYATEAVKDHTDSLESKLSPALKGAYTIINGQVIPVSTKYKNLTGEQMKELDEFAKSFNNLTKEAKGYEKQLLDTEAAQNKLLKEMRDRVIEYQEIMIDAIKNEEKKYIESFKKIIDANKKYIEERKKLYQDSFKEEDSEKEAGDLDKQRQELIEKLAKLEAAHDLSSLQQKQSYREQLQSLDDEYNALMLERNREALIDSLDDQIQYQEDAYQKEEEAYQARINSGIWLEERLKQIQDEARIQALLDLDLQNWSIQKLLEHGYITQDQITEAGITDTNKKVNELNKKQLGVITDHWKANRNVIDKMWNASEVGTVALSQAAMNEILEYMKAHSTAMEGKTTTMKEAILADWEEILEDVAEYTEAFNGVTLKGPNYQDVTNKLNEMIKMIGNKTATAIASYDKLISKANAASKAVDAANSKKVNSSSGGGGTPPKPAAPVAKFQTGTSSASTYSIDYGGRMYKLQMNRNGNFLDGQKITLAQLRSRFPGLINGYTGKAFKTGGTTERTGLHWLDGTPGAPERVLSPGQNKQFEALLSDLTNESRNRKTIEADNTILVEALGKVVDAIYDSSAENADKIARSLADIELSDGSGLGIGRVITKYGVSVNTRSDK